MSRMSRSLALTAFAALAACGSIPTRTFTVDAIDTGEKPVPCLVVVGPDWAGAAEKKQLVNVGGDDTLRIEVQFEKPEVDIFVAALPLDAATGEPRVIPKSRTESTDLTGYIAGTRTLRVDDPDTILFILLQR